MGNSAHGWSRVFTDAELRADLESGLKPSQIAEKRSVSAQAVYKRIKLLRLTTTSAAVVAPVESQRYVNQQLDAMQELGRSVRRVNLLMDACDEWLRDPDRPNRYDIGPRGEEVVVTYLEFRADKPFRAKATLAELLNRVESGGISTVRAETKYADPRELILKTAQEVRQTVAQCVEMAQLLTDARAMQTFREALLVEIAKVSPEVAENIAQAVRRILVLHAASGGPEHVSSGE